MLLESDENIVHTFGFTFGRPTKDADKGYMLLLEVTHMLTNRCGRPRSSPAHDMLSCCLSQVCNCDLGALIYPKAAADKLQPGQQLSIIAQMIKGLAHLHAHGVQHLDM